MDIKIKKTEDDIYIISLTGDFDLYQTAKLRELFVKMTSRDIKKFVIDLSETDYIDASGLGSLICIFTSVKKSNDLTACLCGVKGTVRRVMELTKITEYFTIATDVDAAIDVIRA